MLSSVPEMRQGWLEDTLSTREAQAGIAREVKITERGCAFAERCPVALPDTCVRDLPPLQTAAPAHTLACQHTPDTLGS